MLMKLLYTMVGQIVVLNGFLVGGFIALCGQILAIQAVLATVSVWTVLTALAPILAPLVALGLTLVGRVIWNHERRIRELERGRVRQSRTLYGDEDDPQQQGIALALKNIEERTDELESTIGELRDEIRELNGKE